GFGLDLCQAALAQDDLRTHRGVARSVRREFDRDVAATTRRKRMSIATKHGDRGQTGLAGGIRISKADLRVEAYGTVDELNTVLGFARSICTNKEIYDWTEGIQRTLSR